MYQCYYCNENVGILLDRRLRKSLPMKAGVLDMTPCDKCKDWMKQGIMLISIKDDTTQDDMKGPCPNPYRTGGWCVIKDMAVKGMMDKKSYDQASRHRFMFMADEAWDKLGLPRHGI